MQRNISIFRCKKKKKELLRAETFIVSAFECGVDRFFSVAAVELVGLDQTLQQRQRAFYSGGHSNEKRGFQSVKTQRLFLVALQSNGNV